MKKIQIYIDDVPFQYLKKESKLKKMTISEIIREGIKGKMSQNSSDIL